MDGWMEDGCTYARAAARQIDGRYLTISPCPGHGGICTSLYCFNPPLLSMLLILYYSTILCT
ncbi:hypothetical protein VFPBJ_10959 [Purpureocillium lilacinum]|uniref:Uncharacterized protein n=1 Tax=Purpureocillium lilacinum TaxID=33203 RepID=A0A179FP48_PURLI|nr:hypothetical protein VFPBJ_10959 [Purpureocillium lilacinum]